MCPKHTYCSHKIEHPFICKFLTTGLNKFSRMHRFFQDGQLFTTIYFNQVNIKNYVRGWGSVIVKSKAGGPNLSKWTVVRMVVRERGVGHFQSSCFYFATSSVCFAQGNLAATSKSYLKKFKDRID